MKIKYKRGELTTTQLVVLIILLVSFVIILFLIFRLNLGDTTEKEICRNSVVTRGSSVIPTGSVPLKCQRTYLCLTKDGNCDSVSLTSPVISKVKTKEEVYAVLAKELYDCWWMFGEGKINYVGKDLIPEMYCSLCTQVAFDNSMSEIFPSGQIDQEAIYTYMKDNKISGKDETYLYYLYGVNDLTALRARLNSQHINFDSISLNKQYYVMMGITSKVNMLGWAAVGATATVVGIWLLPIAGGTLAISWGLAGTGGASGAGGTLVALASKGISGNDYISPTIIERDSQKFEALGCKSITTLS